MTKTSQTGEHPVLRVSGWATLYLADDGTVGKPGFTPWPDGVPFHDSGRLKPLFQVEFDVPYPVDMTNDTVAMKATEMILDHRRNEIDKAEKALALARAMGFL